MRNKLLQLFSILLLVMMTACDNSTSFDEPYYDNISVGEIIYHDKTSGSTFLNGLDSQPILVSDIDLVINKNNEATNVLDEATFARVECNGLAYAFVPNIIYEKDINSELFDGSEYIGKNSEISEV